MPEGLGLIPGGEAQGALQAALEKHLDTRRSVTPAEVRPAQEKLQNEQQIGAGMREMPTLCWVWAQRIAAGNAGLGCAGCASQGHRGVDLPKQLGTSCTHPRIPMCRPGAALSCEKALACLSQDRPTPAAVQMGGEGMRD